MGSLFGMVFLGLLCGAFGGRGTTGLLLFPPQEIISSDPNIKDNSLNTLFSWINLVDGTLL